MSILVWDQIGSRFYETGVDHGVLYIPNNAGAYDNGVSWSGLTTVAEKPSGAEANAKYADNMKYLNLIALEQFGATVSAFTYPEEFLQFDGQVSPTTGVSVGQQSRKTFGLSYRSKIGNDVDGEDHGYKLHLVYGCTAAPSERSYSTVNESPEAIEFSWEISTIPVGVTGMKPTSIITIDSTKVDATALENLENFLYGTVGTDPSLPLPDAVIALFSGSVTTVTPTEPAFNSGTHTITIPTVTGVEYLVDGVVVVAGALVIAVDTIVTARPTAGYIFPTVVDDDWFYEYV